MYGNWKWIRFRIGNWIFNFLVIELGNQKLVVTTIGDWIFVVSTIDDWNFMVYSKNNWELFEKN